MQLPVLSHTGTNPGAEREKGTRGKLVGSVGKMGAESCEMERSQRENRGENKECKT